MLKRLPYTVLFIVIAMGVMMGILRPYLIETGQLTPFYTTSVFFHETLQAHRFLGLFYYVALFLQSCLSRPWLGASLLVGLLVVMANVTRWACQIRDEGFGFCWLIPFFLLSTYTEVGYGIYLCKKPIYGFTAIVPLLILLILVGCVRHVCHKHKAKEIPTDRWTYVIPIIVFVAMGYYFWASTYRDENFLNILEMKHAAEKDEWERVLTLSKENKNMPTRLQVCLTRLALYKTGQMGDILFAYRDGDVAYNSPKQQQWLRLIGGPLLYYHYGKPGFAYRWAMEDMVEYGMRPTYLRTLHRVALLNGEEALAQKYEDALQHTLFYHEDKAIIEQEAKDIRPLTNYTDQLDGDNGLVEFYLLQSFAMTEGGSREMVELSLMCNLITKQLDGFWPRFMALLSTWRGQIPRHYQEAALMVAQLQGADSSQLPISDEVRKRFERLVEASAQRGDNASNAYALRPEFGDTYWYYYFFVEGLKTN